MPFQRIHIDGLLGSGAEEWSTSFAVQTLDGLGITDPVVLQDWATDIMTAWNVGTGWQGDLRSMLGSTSSITGIRIYNYQSTTDPANALGQSTSAAVAGSGTVILPFQSSLVYTLRTQVPGRRTRGRMYWPFLTATMLATGQISTSVVTLAARASSFADMLNALCAAGPSGTHIPVIVSKAGGTVTPVTSVRVGNIMDTQRRRRDALVESFGSAIL